MTHRPRGSHRTAFTLVEMLVVVAIIGILAAILVPAVYMGLGAANDARIALELSNLDAAMRQYKSIIHGYAYPPNFGDDTKVKAHIRQKFGRYNPATATAPPTNLDPAEALVFWLQGYSSNPVDPLGGTRKELFDFDETRLVDNGDGDAYKVYYPRSGQKIPYVYFHHDSYGLSYGSATNELKVGGVAHPYKRDGGAEFVNKDSYQIISAGQDGDWGADSTNKQFPSGANYSTTGTDRDNITNFSEGTLGDKQP